MFGFLISFSPVTGSVILPHSQEPAKTLGSVVDEALPASLGLLSELVSSPDSAVVSEVIVTTGLGVLVALAAGTSGRAPKMGASVGGTLVIVVCGSDRQALSKMSEIKPVI